MTGAQSGREFKMGGIRRATYITMFCGAILSGLWLAFWHPFELAYLMPLGLLCGCVGMTRRLRPWLALMLLVCVGVVMGWWRGEQRVSDLRAYLLLRDQKVAVTVVATEDAVYGDSGLLEFDAEAVETTDGRSLSGKIIIAGRGEAMVYRGDVVQAVGTFRPTRGSRLARMNYAVISLERRSQNPVYRWRRSFMAALLSVLPEPHASFGAGLLIGQRDTLPEYLSDQLSAVGLTHIIAVSGYNVTIIVMLARRLFAARSKYQSLVVALGLLGIFLIITGFSASVVRAAIVCSLSLWAWWFGRSIAAMTLIMVPAALTALWNPLYLWRDVGWYLSFLAFFGVLVIAPLLLQRIKTRSGSIMVAKTACVESIAAQSMTIPLILFIFGRLSIVALLANVAVVPLVPIVMFFTSIAGFAGMISTQLGAWLSVPAAKLIEYMLAVTALLEQPAWASVEVKISLLVMLMLYGIIGCITMSLHIRCQRIHGIITDENMVKTERN